jgi:hypothetical protein
MKDVRIYPPVIVVWSEFDEVQSTYEFDTQVRQYVMLQMVEGSSVNLTRASGTLKQDVES